MQGRLRICPQQIKFSKKGDVPSSDLYVFVTCGSQKQRTNASALDQQSKIISWNDNIFFTRTNENVILLELFFDDPQGGRMLGQGKHQLQEVLQHGYKQVFIPLQQSNKDVGTIQVELHFEQEGFEPVLKEQYQELLAEYRKNERLILNSTKSNEALRNKLKDINDKLDKVLQRNKPRKIIRTKAENKQQIEAEIKNADQQLKFYQKELETIKKQEVVSMSVEKILELEAVVREKNITLQTLNEEVKKLQKMIRGSEKQINALQSESDYSKKINMLTGEVKALRDRHRQLEEADAQEEKNDKAKQEYIAKLEKRYQDVCAENNLTPDMDFSKKKEEVIVKNPRNIKHLNVRELMSYDEDLLENEAEVQPSMVTESSIRKLANKLKVLKSTKKINDKKQKFEIEEMNTKLMSLEFEARQIQSEIKIKEKEIHIASSRCVEMKKLLKFNQLTPLEFMQSKQRQQFQLATSKQLLKACLACRYRSTKRDAKGGIFSSNVCPFDDADLFNGQISMRISRIDIYYDAKHPGTIFGFQASYMMPSKYNAQQEEEVQGNLNVGFIEKESADVKSIELTEDDSIKSLSGFATDSINYLKFETVKGQTMEVGHTLTRDKPLEFFLDIGFYAMPILLFGGLDHKKTHPEGQLVLVYIGAEMKNPFAPLQKRNKSLEKSHAQQSQNISKIVQKKNNITDNSINLSNSILQDTTVNNNPPNITNL